MLPTNQSISTYEYRTSMEANIDLSLVAAYYTVPRCEEDCKQKLINITSHTHFHILTNTVLGFPPPPIKNIAVLAWERIKNTFLLLSFSVLKSRNLHRHWKSLSTLVNRVQLPCNDYLEIFTFLAVLIGVTSTVCKIGISQLPQSHLLASQISIESESQPNFYNSICSFSRNEVFQKQNQTTKNPATFPY